MKLIINYLIIIILIGIISCTNDEPSVPIITVTTSDVTVTMDENPSTDDEIAMVTATTNQGSVAFAIVEQTPLGAFTIDAANGKLNVADETLFDYETNPEITGIVEVSNGAISKNANITITLNDIDETVFYGDVTLTTQEEIDAFGAKNYITIDGNFIIDEDQNVHNIVFSDKLSTITNITGIFTIRNMYNWLDLPGFENLTSVGGITITDNWGILDIHSLTNITTCDGDITITNNGDLGGFCGIRPLFQSGSFTRSYTVSGNFYNPTQQDIIDGNCEQF